MQIVLKIVIISLLFVYIIGCSNFRFPGVYRLNVQQGNYVQQKMIDQLEEGMTKRQVQYIMGTPLIQDTFNPDRWDYFFNIKRGDKVLKGYHMTALFESDALVSWDGNYENEKELREKEQREVIDATRKKDQQKF